jgi:hypothetical protein
MELKNTRKVDVSFADEAHRIVDKDDDKDRKYSPADLRAISKLAIACSATPKNVNAYGIDVKRPLFECSPRLARELGECCPPAISIIYPQAGEGEEAGKEPKGPKGIFKVITDTFFDHEKQIKSESADPGALGAKMLVRLKGRTEIKEILRSEEFKKFITSNPTIKFYAIVSDDEKDECGGVWMNQDPTSEPLMCSGPNKRRFFDELQTFSDYDRVIIL